MAKRQVSADVAEVEEQDETTSAIPNKVIGELAKGVAALARMEQITQNLPDPNPKTPWNPEGKARLKKRRKFMMNGALCNPDMMTDEELELMSQIRPGRYNNRRWEVIRRRDKSIDIRYSNATIKHRMELQANAPTLVTMLKQILTEQEAREARRKSGEFDDELDD